jgi:hydroxyethylthiazole kinase
MFDKIKKLNEAIKKIKPLVLNITNDVTMDLVANGLLSVGSSPVMSKAKPDVEDLLKIASVVVINLGTLNEEFNNLCEYTCDLANQLNKPIILDPVGSGATRYRTEMCKKLINNYQIAIVRGNAGEIMSLAGAAAAMRGVDSLSESLHAIEIAKQLNKQHKVAVVVSGKTDVIVDADRINQFNRGSAMMPMITGTGCLLSAIVAAFHAVEADRFIAASAATLFYSICGEIAADQAQGPGSFRAAFLDALSVVPNRGRYEAS